MGQIIGSDKIAIPSHSAGTITLGPSLLTLGGRQYRTSTLSRLISADVTLAASGRYFVYAQIVSGLPALRISATVPSSYYLSNPTATIVGAFYADPLLAFGAFAEITGKPRFLGTSFINWVPVFTAMTCTVVYFHWRLNGYKAHFIGKYAKTADIASEARISYPTGLSSADNTIIPNGGLSVFTQFGHLTWSGSSGSIGYIMGQPSSSYMNPTLASGSKGPLTIDNGNTFANYTYSLNAEVPIAGFTDTPLKDL